MALNLEGKKEIVADVSEKANVALSAVLADYRGLTVDELTQLRSKARSEGVFLKVVRNTLAKRAFSDTEFECLNEHLVGPTIMGLSIEDPGAAARLFKDFSKDHEALEVKVLSVGGKVYGKEDIDVLAKLPTKEQAISMLMSCMQAPASKLVRTLNEVPTKLVRVLAAIKEEKEKAA